MSDSSFLPEALQDPNNCLKGLIPGWRYAYGYRPSLAAGIAFCVLFSIAFFGHGFQSFRRRRWTSILLTVGSLTELIGWAGRTWAAECPYNQNAFLIQITTLIIGPVFVTAALYVLLGIFIILLGRESSLLSARMYAIVFMTCDIISLVVQAVGGAMASSGSSNGEDPKTGTDIMIAGVVFQLIAMTIFAGLAMDFMRRSIKLGIPQEYYKILAALFISLAAIYARSVFRTVELAQGWTGYLMEHESYFIALDGSLMVIAVGIFLALDPARTLPQTRSATGGKESSDFEPETVQLEQRT